MVSIGRHMSVYTGAKTVVRTVYGTNNGFELKVSMHQGSELSHLLFVIVMEGLSREFRVALPWDLMYTDDLVEIAETKDDLTFLSASPHHHPASPNHPLLICTHCFPSTFVVIFTNK